MLSHAASGADGVEALVLEGDQDGIDQLGGVPPERFFSSIRLSIWGKYRSGKAAYRTLNDFSPIDMLLSLLRPLPEERATPRVRALIVSQTLFRY